MVEWLKNLTIFERYESIRYRKWPKKGVAINGYLGAFFHEPFLVRSPTGMRHRRGSPLYSGALFVGLFALKHGGLV